MSEPSESATGLRWAMVLVGLLTMVTALLALDARATYGARISVDEPQYLLTAISLAEDLDLDISDELDEQRFLPFHERPTLSQQTTDVNESGQRLSPHDPLLPVLLAAPMELAGWIGARIAMAVMAGATAAATIFVGVRRLGLAVWPTAPVVAALFMSPPLVAFGNQIYPAMPAALTIIAGLAVVTSNDRRRWWAGTLLVVALPWLSVKYVPHAGVLAAGLLWSIRRDRVLVRRTVGMLAAMGVAYLALHRGIWGGWTVYASGDHFVEAGSEWQVVGSRFNPWGRTRRLVGLLVDRGFGLAAWAPVFLAAPAAMVHAVRRRISHWPLLVGLVVVGWAMATWIALTMHGWWWPGRQVVPIVPILVLGLAHAVGASRGRLAAVMMASAVSIAGWLWLVVEASTGRRTLVFDFRDTGYPWYPVWSRLLPDHERFELGDPVLTIAWTIVLLATMVAVWCRTSPTDVPVSGAVAEARPAPAEA